jgi:predicted Zn-dependent protease
MATDRPLEHFLVLNGRGARDAVRPGEQVKLVRWK